MPIDPNSIEIDTEALQEAIEETEVDFAVPEAVQAQQEINQQQTQALNQEQLEVDDPRNKENWGVAGVAKELQSVLSGGLQDTASSIATFPERTADALSGEMQKEKKEKGYYRPDWHPFTDYENPIITKTWWGKLARGVVHFGSLAAAIIPAAKFTAARMGITTAGTLAANSFVRAAGVGAVSDLVSKESDGHNALGTLRDQYGFIDTPISTRDSDHPVVMKMKNIMEGMGIGTVFDGAWYLIGKGSKNVKAKIVARNQNIEDQVNEAGLAQLRRGETEFRADKNKPVAEPHQGAHTSQQEPWDAFETEARRRKEWGAEEGSTGSVTTAAQREVIAREAGVTAELVEDVLRRLLSNDRYNEVVEMVKRNRKTLLEVFGDSILAHQRITAGRNAVDLDPMEYLKELFETSDRYDITDGAGKKIDTLETLTSKNVVVTDLVVGTLLHQLRDLGIAGRELEKYVTLTDVDGPAKQVIDTMLVALTETKRARIVKSANFRELGAGKQRQYLSETLSKDMADTKDAIMTVLKIAKEDADPNLLNALFEMFSSMKTVHSLDDMDNWARKMIKGGKIDPNGPDRTGAFIRELEGVMIHGILSGPKTPMRAILGTSTATFLRPLSQFIGATMMYPFTKDSATIRAGLSSLNAMMEAIPESFELFKTKLNSYMSGDVASLKSRYYEYTRNDDNWEILRRWAEDSGRATDGERAMFSMANMARNMNNSGFFAYSTKIMAATDDAFGYILARAKAREKAMRSVLDIQASGGKLPDITPSLMRAYEQDFYGQIWDGDGNIIDEAVKFAKREVTLTQELTGFSKGLNDVFTAHPLAKPFFLFARTGVNGLKLTAKHTPGFNFLVKEFNEIAFARPDNLEAVAKYGITTPAELANAQALQVGRLGIGSAMVSIAGYAYMNGKLTGNGPVDRQKRQMWIDGGYRPRQFQLGDIWFGYDSIEPFNLIMSTIADIGDASTLMGSEWTENELQKVALVMAQAVTSKSYLAGMQQFVDLFSGKPGQQNRIIANLMNNAPIPLAGLRNEIGKLFVPHMRELNTGIGDALRNRNLTSELLPGPDLPIKYDILNGRPVRDWDFLTRAFNMVSPIALNLDHSDGRKFLFASGYDIRTSTFYSPNGDDLSDSPMIRSLFQQAIGKQGLEAKLNILSKDPRAIASLAEMTRVINAGERRDYESSDFWHNQKIHQLFETARRRAWASIQDNPNIQRLASEQKEAKKKRVSKQEETRTILSIYK